MIVKSENLQPFFFQNKIKLKIYKQILSQHIHLIKFFLFIFFYIQLQTNVKHHISPFLKLE